MATVAMTGVAGIASDFLIHSSSARKHDTQLNQLVRTSTSWLSAVPVGLGR